MTRCSSGSILTGSGRIAVLAAALIAAPLATAATEVSLDADIRGGYDDNPLQLRDDLNPEGAGFVDAALRFAAEREAGARGAVRFGARANARQFDSGAEDADRWDGRLEIGYRDRKRSARGLRRSLKLRYSRIDRTWVDRRPGTVGVIRGIRLEDRYDTGTVDLIGRLDLRIRKVNKLLLDVDYRARDYLDDYAEAGVTRLDYSQWRVTPRFTRKFGDDTEVGIALPVARRTFDDRRARDASGARVAGTDLSYDYFGWDVTVRHRFSEALALRGRYSQQYRRDDAVGFDDTTRNEAQVGIARDGGGPMRWSLQARWSDRRFDNGAAALDPTEEGDDGRAREQWDLRFRMSRDVRRGTRMPLTLFASVRHVRQDHSDARLSFERNVFAIGVEVRPDFRARR